MSKRVLLVTGGSRGIGAATCRLAAKAGYAVAINYLADAEQAQALADDLRTVGCEAMTVQADVSKIEDIQRMFAEVDRFGTLAGLVNNAGITGKSSRLDQVSDQTLIECIAVNVTGAIVVAREAVKRMSTRHGGQGGVIVNIGSAAGSIGRPGEYTWYAATKGAIESFTIGLGRELAEEAIRVVCVSPGLTDTEIHARSTLDPGRVARMAPVIPLKRAGTAEEIAQTVLFALSDAASYITATTLRVAGGR